MTPDPLASLRDEAWPRAREAVALADSSRGLTFQLDRGLPTADDDDTLRALRQQALAASQRFDAFVAEAVRSRPALWRELTTTIASALAVLSGLASSQRSANALLPAWQKAAAGAIVAEFAQAFVEGLQLVDQNYRLLLKSGDLPRGFPRLAGERR
jgi:hypothetical protein